MAVVQRTLRERRARVLADNLPGEAIRDVALVVGFAAFVGLMAQLVIKLPFTPIPITGQTFGVLLGGMALGWRRALAGMVLYLLVGLVGLPWFAEGRGGLGVLSVPSAGYLAGFVVAAPIVGRLAELGADRKPWLTLPAMVAGNLVIYAFGLAWLVFHVHLPFGTAVQLGLTPFLLGDAIKAVLAAALLPGAWLLVGRR